MVDGTSTESLALEVARKFALPPAILRRATSLYQVSMAFLSRMPPEASVNLFCPAPGCARRVRAVQACCRAEKGSTGSASKAMARTSGYAS